MITLGTGVGSGIVINGQLVYGHDGFAGELGHVVVRRENGRQCGHVRRVVDAASVIRITCCALALFREAQPALQCLGNGDDACRRRCSVAQGCSLYAASVERDEGNV